MEEMNTMIANEVAADVAPVDAADINTEISDTIEASTSQFGLKEGLVLGGLVLGTGAIIYTGIDIFKKLKKRHDEKKAAATMAAMDAPMKAAEAVADQITDEEAPTFVGDVEE
jgi:bisphosphoglycerate-independent phosphoglycerate mutase (AlkP superfamily)